MENRRLTARSPIRPAKRFRDHREAIRWSFAAPTRWYIKFLPAGLLGMLIHFVAGFLITGERPDMMLLVFVLAIIPAVIWIFVAPAIYLCVVLAGGIMRREERSRR